MIRSLLAKLLPTVLAAAALGTAHAGEWPERPIKLVVPYPAGGLTDIVSRIVGEEVGKALNTSVVIENKAGAGGQIGLQGVLQAPKDGYTVALVVPATMVTLPLTNPDYKIKPLEQFEPITIAVDTFMALVVDNRLGVKTVNDFVALAKKKPGDLNYGTPARARAFTSTTCSWPRSWALTPPTCPTRARRRSSTTSPAAPCSTPWCPTAARPMWTQGR